MPDRCFDFTQGRCNRGEDCRFTHSESNEPTCFDYSVGRCNRGEDCKFVHADEHVPSRGGGRYGDNAAPRYEERRDDRYVMRRDDRRGGRDDYDRYDDRRAPPSRNNYGTVDRCFDFTQGRCTRGDDCRFMHPETCFDFTVGKCNRDDCRYFHAAVHTPARRGAVRERSPPRNDRMRSYGAPRGFDRVGRVERPYDRRDDRGRYDERPEPNRCFDFTQGRCTRGKNCRFVHGETCYDFSVGNCNRDSCRFLHVPREQGEPTAPRDDGPRGCYDFSQGRCDRGENCKFSHDVSPRGRATAR